MNMKKYMEELTKQTQASVKSFLEKELPELAKENEALAAKYDPAKLDRVVEFVTDGARTIAVKGQAVLSEEQVRQMAIDWYVDDIEEQIRKEEEEERKKEEERRKNAPQPGTNFERQVEAYRLKEEEEKRNKRLAMANKLLPHHLIPKQAALFVF